MIEVAFACPKCDHEAGGADLSCPCGFSAPFFAGSIRDDGRPVRCPLCGDPRLYVQRDFSRKMGIGLLVAGFALAVLLGMVVGPWGFFAALGASVGLDTLLWAMSGNVVICHWCETHLRGGPEDYPEFDLAVHDVVRFQKEVAAQGQRVPEHEGTAPAGAAEAHPTRYDG